ncbi:MAG: nucleotide pyrophosphatase [Planctomycetaceae bacterium]|nr:nucleotide pyrophosphatase [Planctomycetaceae bacterium]
MQRREFVKLAITATGAVAVPGCGGSTSSPPSRTDHRVYVLAFDGLDPRIVNSLLDAGRMPNLAKLKSRGGLHRLGTSTPPHTPVAFSNIISGADPGIHQVFDFIHRDCDAEGLAIRPYFSTADVVAPELQWAIPLGKWHLPLSGERTELLRRGPAFWDTLVSQGIDTEIHYLPSNYPPQEPQGPGRFRCISGMGTPDLMGSYGEFTLFTPDVPRQGKIVGGGRFVHLSMHNHFATAELTGPSDFLRRPAADGDVPIMKVSVDICRDPKVPAATIVVDGKTSLLKEGEWSDWIPIVFRTSLPGSSVLQNLGVIPPMQGIVRLFMKQVHPKFELYVSPINIDPLSPINPISVPAGLAPDLARRHGRFYTAGIPEDTKSLSHGALDEDQFLAQSELAMQERILQYRDTLRRFQRGCLFFYFGATDLVQHMFWRDRDLEHPGRLPSQEDRYAEVVDDIYQQVDEIVGDALQAAGPTDTVMVMSDHGFTSFRRGFNLNSWLLEQGFIRLRNPSRQGQWEMFLNVDWSGTTAYGLGMNALYLNARGREKNGIVKESQWNSKLNEIRDKLLEVRDANGQPVIRRVDLVSKIYPQADNKIAPDLIVGYEDGYRASWDTVLGKMPREILVDNMDRWSGTHLISADLVPGILVTSSPVRINEPDIRDIAPTILAEFDIATPSQMSGRPLFS